MKVFKKIFIIDFIITILIMILMVLFSSIMIYAFSLCIAGLFIYNWIYLNCKRDEIKSFYYNYYEDKKYAEFLNKLNIFVTHCMLIPVLILIIKFIKDLRGY